MERKSEISLGKYQYCIRVIFSHFIMSQGLSVNINRGFYLNLHILYQECSMLLSKGLESKFIMYMFYYISDVKKSITEPMGRFQKVKWVNGVMMLCENWLGWRFPSPF